MGARDILAELTRIGAIGSSVTVKAEEPRLESVTIEQGPPNEAIFDERGEAMIEACEHAINSLDRMLEAQQDLRNALLEMLHTWSDSPESQEEAQEEAQVEDYEEQEEQDRAEAEEPILLTRRSSRPPAPTPDPEVQVTSEDYKSIDDFLSELEQNQSSFAEEDEL